MQFDRELTQKQFIAADKTQQQLSQNFSVATCPFEHVNRQFKALAPNRIWDSDFTYVATWRGFDYVAFVIDGYV